MTMKKDKNKIQKEKEYFNRVKQYIVLEYSKELQEKMCSPKYLNISFSYSNNCFSLNRPVQFTANEIARFLNKTN